KRNNQCTQNQKSIDELIKAMDRFSDVVNISRRGEFKTELSFLSQRLANISFDDDSTSEDFNYQLIKFLREPIEREYKSLVEYQAETAKDDLSYVEWCLKHDYVQQALTLFKECVPSFLVDKGLIVIDEKKFSAYLKDESLKKNKDILEAAFNKWKSTNSKLDDNALVTFNAFYKEYASVFQPEEDVRDDVDLVFNEINAHRSQLILKYSHRAQLFKKLKELLKDYVKDVQNTEFKITRDSKSTQERNEKLETVLKSKQVDLLKALFDGIRAFKLVPVKDDSSKAKKVISFLTTIAMNATDLKDVNNLPIKVREMIYNGNVSKLNPYVSNKEDFQFLFNDVDYKELRLDFYKILKNQIKEDVLFGDITKGFILTEYDFEQEAKDIYKTCDTSLYNIEGLVISDQFKDSLAQVIKILAYYFEIKKSRNDSNHARIEESSQFTTSSEIKCAMDECIKLIRELIK
ncbi:MAG: TM1812 family CRISPR-associated protein, partial [Streptococcus sp.]|nr:TM1812 family CRISPR-associated protein [Streptococcus sp.]